MLLFERNRIVFRNFKCFLKKKKLEVLFEEAHEWYFSKNRLYNHNWYVVITSCIIVNPLFWKKKKKGIRLISWWPSYSSLVFWESKKLIEAFHPFSVHYRVINPFVLKLHLRFSILLKNKNWLNLNAVIDHHFNWRDSLSKLQFHQFTLNVSNFHLKNNKLLKSPILQPWSSSSPAPWRQNPQQNSPCCSCLWLVRQTWT